MVVEGKTINAGRHKSVLLRIDKKEDAELSVDTKTENGRLIYKEKTRLGKAEYHNWSPMLAITPEASHLLSMGAGGADGGCKLPALVYQLRKPREPRANLLANKCYYSSL